MAQASGSFEVNITPQTGNTVEGVSLGRLALDKQFHGDLEATSKGEMLSAGTEVGSAVYVAIERVTGTLHGRSGSFVLVHKGTMTSAGQELTISVAPDSGTGELAGLAGTMSIAIVEGNHSYSFEYTLAEAA
ncbi:MAG: DUF3224 domain-containing protein [Chloroflexi bacterium]|nr:DUF3224 domain-containing protein [Chloroflexota bacterium]